MVKKFGVWRFCLVLLAFLALLAACEGGGSSSSSSSSTEVQPTPSPNGGDDDAAIADDDDDDDDDATAAFWPPDETGPYNVGVITVQTRDETRWELWGLQARGLPLEIWYPAESNDGTPNNVGEMVGDLPEWLWPIVGLVYGSDLDRLLATPTAAKRGATPAGGGPYPVVLFSHGISAIRFQNYTLCEHLASHGFVVVAPDHYDGAIFTNLGGGDVVIFDPLTWVTGIFDRPLDVEFVHQYLQSPPANAGLINSIPMDLPRFGVTGHSYGGLTAMEVGPAYPEFVKAIAALNPLFLDYYPQDYTAPFLMLQSAEDEIVGIGNNATRGAFEKAASAQKVYLQLDRGSHYSVTDACALLPPIMITPARGCGVPDRIDSGLANRISAAYLTAFFKLSLAGDELYRDYLLENHFPDEMRYAVQWPQGN